MKNWRRIVLFWNWRLMGMLSGFLLFHTPLLSQGEPYKKFQFQHFGIESGLSNRRIIALCRDRDGLLWMGTSNGLNCFDGVHFRSWMADPFDKTKLENGEVQGVAADPNGNMWCSTRAGVSRFDRKSFRNYKLRSVLDNENVTYNNLDVICTHHGEIYAVTVVGLFRFEAKADSFFHISPELPDSGKHFREVFPRSFQLDSLRNGLWMGTDLGLVFYDLATRKYVGRLDNPRGWDVFNTHDIHPLTMDRHGRLIYNDTKIRELITWDPETNQRSSISTKEWYDKGEFLYNLFVDADDNKWISTWSPTMYFVDAHSGRAVRFGHDAEDKYSIAGDFFDDAHEDSDGTIFFGTINGLSITNLGKRSFSILELPDTIDHRTFFFGSFFLGEDFQNNLWFTPSYEYLLKYDPREETFRRIDFFEEPVHVSSGKWPTHVQSMLPLKDTLVFGTTRGFFTFDLATEQIAPLANIPDSIRKKLNDIKLMLYSKDNEIWAVCHRVGLLRYDWETKKSRIYVLDPKDAHAFPDGLISHMIEAPNGEIWFTNYDTGPFKYNAETDGFEFLPDSIRKQIGIGVFVFSIDQKGDVWMMNNITGLLHYDPVKRVLRHDIGRAALKHSNYGNMAIDDNQKLWMVSYNDFSTLDTRTFSVENFSIEHSSDDQKWWDYLVKLRDGRIVSEGRNAIVIFDPNANRGALLTDPIVISNLVVGDTFFHFPASNVPMKLAYWQNYFSLDFGTIGLVKGTGLKFEYKLEGFDPEWIDAGDRFTAYYTNVPGGSYTFKVRSQDANGKWHEGQKQVRIIVGSIFYKTAWFKILLMLLLVVAMLVWAMARRMRRQKEIYERAINYFANSRQGNNDVNGILWDITNNVISLTDFMDCVIYMLDETGEVLVKTAAYGEKNSEIHAETNPTHIRVTEGIVGRSASLKQAIIVPDTRKDPYYIRSQMQGRSELAVPIIHDGQVLGVIDAEHPRKNFFKKPHLDLLTTIASISSSKIANAQKATEIEENERRLKELQSMVSETRQLALRAQMNPHFIFNCLNSINSFILDNDQETASRYLIKFAKLIRLILENSNSKLIPLQSELDALKLYIEMEALRFEPKFTWQIEVDEEVAPHHVMVPPLILQPFVENAIWHGLLHKTGPGDLTVAVTQPGNTLICTITDNGVGREASRQNKAASLTQKQSLGLKLTQERLALMHEQEQKKFKVEIFDLYDKEGNPSGTQVVIEMELHN